MTIKYTTKVPNMPVATVVSQLITSMLFSIMLRTMASLVVIGIPIRSKGVSCVRPAALLAVSADTKLLMSPFSLYVPFFLPKAISRM